MEIKEIINNCCSLAVYSEGQKIIKKSSEKDFKKIIEAWNSMTDGALEMPAFGVSIDKYTKEQLKSGLWVEFIFDAQLSHCDMPFSKLLVNVVGNFKGFNLSRYTQEAGYAGRCFYLQLSDDMSDFEKVVKSCI